MRRTHAWLRWLVVLVLAATQVAVAVPAQAASTETENAMPGGLYDSFLNATSSGTPSFRENNHSFSLQASGLQAQLDDSGLALSASSGSGWNWDLQVNGFGRGSSPSAASRPTISAAAGRVTYRYNGFSQWLRNTGVGIEQGFTIEQNPRGSGRLVLRMQLHTNLTGSLSKDARTLSFVTGDGQSLNYSNLRVLDAAGRELAASLAYAPGQILIRVDDRNALYPLTVDPLVYLETKRLSLDGAANDRFGNSVAISGDTAIVGTYLKNINQGAAYIFQRSGLTWTQTAELTASDGAHFDDFGVSVAISGDTAIVGAAGKNTDRGNAYVFVKPGGGWADATETAKLGASDAAIGDKFGISVAISGDTAIVGAYTKNSYHGKAYVFARPAGGWHSMTETAGLTTSDGAANDFFGVSVAISGDTAIVGAAGKNTNQGKVYAFTRPGGGWLTATETAQLTASDGAAGDAFGESVAISGNTAIVGAPQKNSFQGKAYIFIKPGGSWSNTVETAGLTASDGAANDWFGLLVAISGDTAVVGAYGKSAFQGKAYVYVKPGSGWTSNFETNGLVASDGVAGDHFGRSVAISGDTAVIAAPYDTVGTNTNQGSAYFYFPYRTDQDLALGAQVSAPIRLPGQSVNFTASITNYGPGSAPALLVSAPLPAGFTVLNAVPSAGVYDASSGSWSLGALAFGVTATLDIQATVPSSVAGSHPLFSPSLLGWDTNNTNNSASAGLYVPLLSVSPGAAPFANQLMLTASPVQTITVSNLNNGAIQLGSMTMPAGFLVSSDGCSMAIVPGLGTCTFNVQFKPSLAAAYSGGIIIPALSPSDATGLIASGMGVAGTQLSTNTSFETDANHDRVPDGWKKGGTWLALDGRTTGTKHSGTASLEFIGNRVLKTLSFTQLKSGVAGDDFLLSLWSRALGVPKSGTTYSVTLKFFNGNTAVGSSSVNIARGTHPFTNATLAFTAPAAYTRVQVLIQFKASAGTVWFDDLSLLWAP